MDSSQLKVHLGCPLTKYISCFNQNMLWGSSEKKSNGWTLLLCGIQDLKAYDLTSRFVLSTCEILLSGFIFLIYLHISGDNPICCCNVFWILQEKSAESIICTNVFLTRNGTPHFTTQVIFFCLQSSVCYFPPKHLQNCVLRKSLLFY